MVSDCMYSHYTGQSLQVVSTYISYYMWSLHMAVITCVYYICQLLRVVITYVSYYMEGSINQTSHNPLTSSQTNTMTLCSQLVNSSCDTVYTCLGCVISQ